MPRKKAMKKTKLEEMLFGMKNLEYMELKRLVDKGNELLRAKKEQRINDLKAEIEERNNEIQELSREDYIGG